MGAPRSMEEVKMATVQEIPRPKTVDSPEAAPRRIVQVGEALSGATETAASAVGAAASRLPEAAATSRRALVEANHQIQAGSDEMLIVGSALSFGFAMGLLFGGANRLLVAGALLPAASMGLTILERANQGWLVRSSRPKDH